MTQLSYAYQGRFEAWVYYTEERRFLLRITPGVRISSAVIEMFFDDLFTSIPPDVEMNAVTLYRSADPFSKDAIKKLGDIQEVTQRLVNYLDAVENGDLLI